MIKSIGFTGSKQGMSRTQKVVLTNTLDKLVPKGTGAEFHHGDCTGADSQAHDIAQSLGLQPVIHPPTERKYRAFRTGMITYPPLPYLDRNQAIVDRSELLIATPRQRSEILRSGTWATVRRARKAGRKIIIIFPDGRVTREYPSDSRHPSK